MSNLHLLQRESNCNNYLDHPRSINRIPNKIAKGKKKKMASRPRGPPVQNPTPAPRPSPVILKGRTVTLEPLNASHADRLFPHASGPENAWIWDYMHHEPATTVDQLRSYLNDFANPSSGCCLWAALVRTKGQQENQDQDQDQYDVVGYLGYLNIVPKHRTIEIGNVLFTPAIQRTTAATEAVYLLLRHAFRDLGYRRVEWKCDNLNEASKRAARRFGFSFEGVFRQHMIIKGCNRDTAWFAVLDCEWERLEKAFEGWLSPENFDDLGRQKRKLEEFRG